MYLNSGFLGFKPLATIGTQLPVAGDHLDFMARSDHTAGHFVRASATRHIWGVEVLV
jgi:hypothetical protein